MSQFSASRGQSVYSNFTSVSQREQQQKENQNEEEGENDQKQQQQQSRASSSTNTTTTTSIKNEIRALTKRRLTTLQAAAREKQNTIEKFRGKCITLHCVSLQVTLEHLKIWSDL